VKYWKETEGNITLGDEFEGGGWFINIPNSLDVGYHLYEISRFGGKPQFRGSYCTLLNAIEAMKSIAEKALNPKEP